MVVPWVLAIEIVRIYAALCEYGMDYCPAEVWDVLTQQRLLAEEYRESLMQFGPVLQEIPLLILPSLWHDCQSVEDAKAINEAYRQLMIAGDPLPVEVLTSSSLPGG